MKGKSRFCAEQYPKHQFLNTKNLYYENNSLSLHRVINKIIKHLEENQNVVLEDAELAQEKTRKSICQAISNKNLNCKITSVFIVPIGSKMQCHWANQFALAGVLFVL